MNRLLHICLTSLLLLLFLAGCQKSAPQDQPTPTTKTTVQVAPSPAYSPFVLKIASSEVPFDTISFKNVGLQTSQEDADVLYETLAESLSLELSTQASFPVPTEVVHNTDILNPDNHKSCGSKHIYIDVWEQSAPAMWGYSLWSGCDEDSQFAWRQLPQHSHQDLTQTVHPLTQDIAAHLRRATQTGCFSKNC